MDTQIYHSVTLLGDVDDLVGEHQMMDDTSICLSREGGLHVEVDPAVCPGSMRQHESMGADMGMIEHIVMSDSSQRHVEM